VYVFLGRQRCAHTPCSLPVVAILCLFPFWPFDCFDYKWIGSQINVSFFCVSNVVWLAVWTGL
jgi:hypothetical protein